MFLSNIIGSVKYEYVYIYEFSEVRTLKVDL